MDSVRSDGQMDGYFKGIGQKVSNLGRGPFERSMEQKRLTSIRLDRFNTKNRISSVSIVSYIIDYLV